MTSLFLPCFYYRMNELELKKDKILLIAATHGDEALGVRVVEQLKKSGIADCFDFIIGNPRAYKNAQRFVQSDMNRLYPGKKNSHIYEETQAWRNLRLAKNYRYIIDIHEAQSKDDFMIIPQDRISSEELVAAVPVKKIVLWPSTSGRKTGPLGKFLDNCLEIEFGTKGLSEKVATTKAKKVLVQAIKNLSDKKIGQKGQRFIKKQIYLVYGKLMKIEGMVPIKKLKDFRKISLLQEKFIPLLVGQYLTSGIICYKMKLYE